MAFENRTIIVLTRLSATELHATYCNALADRRPYVMTITTRDAPLTAAGVSQAEIPGIGATVVLVRD